jgi:SAM-dependent methyltransferase
MTPEQAVELNRRAWDTLVPFHLRSDFYDVAGFKAGRDTLTPIEAALLPDVRGKSLLHLQCHFGLDTLSWARRGASVTGLDISQPAIDGARALAAELGIDARFVRAEVYDAPAMLAGETFDIAFTSLGALLWMPDIRRWAQVVGALTRRGGTLVVVDLHPLIYTLPQMSEQPDLRIVNDYFDRTPKTFTEPGSYASDEAPATTTVEFPHTMADILNAVIDAGFHIERFDEHPEYMCRAWPWLEPHPEFPQTLWRPPAGVPRMPLMFSLKATRS